MTDDFPTFDFPANAIWTSPSFGQSATDVTERMNSAL